MMRIGKGVRELLYKFDFFYEANFLRYKDESYYNTLTGGIVSLAIILLVTLTFSDKVSRTLGKINIESSQEFNYDKDPTPYQINGQNSKFMLGVEIWGVNLNDGPRYFDVVLVHTVRNREEITSIDEIKLEPCTQDHWKQLPDILTEAKELNYQKWLCLPLNASIEIKGKFLSKQFKNLHISIRKCSTIAGQTRSCAATTEMDALGSPYTSSIYFINSNINAGRDEYLTYYLESANSIIFSKTFGPNALLFIEDFEIQTDQSILPWSSIKTQSGAIIDEYAIQQFTQTAPSDLQVASFQLRKSPNSRNYTRSFDKFDELFSYLGGLISTITMIFITLNYYNSYNFSVSIGARIFKSQSKDRMGIWQRYHLLDFIGHLIYSWCETFGFSPNWARLKSFYKVQAEIGAQLDAKFLIQRLIFMERALEMILDEHQLKGIHLFDKPTIEQSENMRKKYYIQNRIKNKIKEKIKKYEQSGQKRDQNIQIYPQNSQHMINVKSNIENSRNQANLKGSQNKKNSEESINYLNKENEVDQAYEYLSEISEEEGDQEHLKEEEKALVELQSSALQNNKISKRIWKKLYPNMREEINTWGHQQKQKIREEYIQISF